MKRCLAVLGMRVCSALKRCVIIRVHDRKPVLTEGGTVRPPEVFHKLVGKERPF